MSGQLTNSNDGLTITVKQDNEVSGEQFSNSSQVGILLKGIVGFPPWSPWFPTSRPADKEVAQEQKGGSLQHTWTSALIISKRHSLSNQKILLILLKGIVYFLLPHTFLGQLQWKRDLLEWVLCPKNAMLVPNGWSMTIGNSYQMFQISLSACCTRGVAAHCPS